MRRHVVDHVAPPIYGAVDFAVIIAPALYLKAAADRAGMGVTEGVDLLVASAVIGAAHAVLAWSRLRSEKRVARRRADLWIAAIDALVVLALGATLLLIAVLHGFADGHATLADRGYPVVALWVGIQLLAVTGAEATGWLVFWWLEPQEPKAAEHLPARR
ncbi:MAG: hypothetical protein M3O23_05505 [Actinomycetota bacterium]|nr:hypothetical protein [Actinomycetota bacterium]